MFDQYRWVSQVIVLVVVAGCSPSAPSSQSLSSAAESAVASFNTLRARSISTAGALGDGEGGYKSPLPYPKDKSLHAPGYVTLAVNYASQRTGVPHRLLMTTARRESGFNPYAKARGSSAAGLFQFIDQTWLATVQRHGHKYGLAGLAKTVSINSRGQADVADIALKREILALRYDANLSALLGAELVNDYSQTLREHLGREPTQGEAYMAVFMGAGGAVRLLEASARTPALPADRLFPAAAAANPTIFYANGRARSVWAVKTVLIGLGEA